MATTIIRGTTSNKRRFLLGVTGLSSSSSGLIISTICDNEATATVYTQAASNIETITTLGTYAAPTSGKCRFREVDATNHPGLYEFQFADARFAVANSTQLVLSVSGATGLPSTGVHYEIDLVPQAENAIVTYNLDHLMHTAAVSGDVANSSVIARITGKGLTPSFSTFNNTTDSLQALSEDKLTSTGVANAVWDDTTAAHTTAGTFGKALGDTNTNVSTLLTRITSSLFTGITSLRSWLGALAGKTADTTTRAEINATTAGATYNETTDSLEAQKDAGGGGGDATLAKQNEILAALGAGAIVRVPVISASLIEVTEGITYDGTLLAKLFWTTTTDYTGADSITLKVWRQEEDGTRTLMKTATATATSATNVELTTFTATFLAALRYQGTPAFDRLQFCLYATEGSNDYEIASGDFRVKERRTA